MVHSTVSLTLLKDPLVDARTTVAARGHKDQDSLRSDIKRGVWIEPILIGLRGDRWRFSEVEKLVEARVAGFTDDQMRELVVKLRARRKALGDRLKDDV